MAILLTGCTAARLGYTNGETISYWWLNGYVDFEVEQKSWVRERIDGLFAWHRKTQLKDYAQVLAFNQKRLQRNVTSAELLADYAGLKKHALLLVDQSLPHWADLALSLDLEQIGNIEKKFAANNDKYRKEYLRGDLAQRQLVRYEKIMDYAEYLFDDFSREQERLIRQTSDARPLNNELWLAERQRRQQTLIALLKKIQVEKPNRDKTMVLLKGYVLACMDHFGNAENKAFFDAHRESSAQMFAVIINNTTPEQKAHAVKRLQQWINDFNELAE